MSFQIKKLVGEDKVVTQAEKAALYKKAGKKGRG